MGLYSKGCPWRGPILQTYSSSELHRNTQFPPHTKHFATPSPTSTAYLLIPRNTNHIYCGQYTQRFYAQTRSIYCLQRPGSFQRLWKSLFIYVFIYLFILTLHNVAFNASEDKASTGIFIASKQGNCLQPNLRHYHHIWREGSRKPHEHSQTRCTFSGLRFWSGP
jgi:hypothetical protein